MFRETCLALILLNSLQVASLSQHSTGTPGKPKPAQTNKTISKADNSVAVKFNDKLQAAITKAVEANNVQEVAKLLKQHANPNSQMPDGDTLLLRAIEHNNLEIVKLLYNAGANLSDYGGGEDNGEDSPLMAASLLNSIPIVRFLLSKGAFVDQVDKVGGTSLMAVAGYGYTEVAQLLITKGANVNVASHAGGTPLMMAAANNQKNMVKLLMQHQADTSLKDKWGETALTKAINHNYPDIVKLLQQPGTK